MVIMNMRANVVIIKDDLGYIANLDMHVFIASHRGVEIKSLISMFIKWAPGVEVSDAVEEDFGCAKAGCFCAYNKAEVSGFLTSWGGDVCNEEDGLDAFRGWNNTRGLTLGKASNFFRVACCSQRGPLELLRRCWYSTRDPVSSNMKGGSRKRA